MIRRNIKTLFVFLAGLGAGLAATQLPVAVASSTPPASDLGQRKFVVAIDEIQKNFVFGEQFSGSYKKEVTMSDGKTRTIELTPMVHNGMQVVRFNDTGGVTYMGLNGTTTNGKLMVMVADMESQLKQLREQGWKFDKK